ncbi:protein unc-93 homolog A-like isoform X2 [Dendropsophus ebraccatus]|uniref:protein unc-93 homolog A-like isoform X2 n=1 Tax=Dendropsophus ebraccatus TaxID=150705 RepID=UPI0038310493
MEIKHLKNILIVSFGFLLLFTAYGGLQAIQSSLNPEKGLGVASLGVIYGCLILSSLFLPPILINKFGCKWTIVISMCCYITYSIGNFKPNWYSLIITSAILGFGAGPLWASKCTYLTTSGIRYAKQAGKENMDIVNQYFGLFFLIYQSSGIWGNLISSLVLKQNTHKVSSDNMSYSYCGANSCPAFMADLSNITTPASGVPDTMRYTLMGIYTGSGLIAILLVVFCLDQIDLSEEQKEDNGNPTFCNSLLGTIQQLRDIRQWLLIPLTMFSGFQQGFLASEYTKAYVTCALGIHFVGYVMICFGAINSIFSMVFGKISQYTGRIGLFMLGFYGVLFDDHKAAAFANYRLWESLGYVIAFAYSNLLCVSIKLYIVLSVLLVGMTLYLVVESLECRKQKTGAQDKHIIRMKESMSVLHTTD